METNVKAIELRDLWRRYKGSGDVHARERLVVAYSPLVKYVSGRMAKLAPDSIRLETPAAIVGVRGTSLAIRVEP